MISRRAVYAERRTYGSEEGAVRPLIKHQEGAWSLSCDPAPSREDIDVTKRLAECGKILGIEILDHLIIGDKKYVSLKEKGYL